MTLVELLLFLIFTTLIAIYFNYFGVSPKDRSDSPNVILVRWIIWLVISGLAVWGLYSGVNYLVNI
jgi:uncharacterized BrkB/YihY/UPF0761 family membrane protein